MSVADLNTSHGVDGRVSFLAGDSGCTRLQLKSGGSIAEAYLHGGHVTRYSVDGYEAFWMSSDAVLKEGKAIRGGIPLCWPWFGPNEKGQHGFVRSSNDWKVARSSVEGDVTSVTLQLDSSPQTLAVWPHAFTLEYELALTPKEFKVLLTVKNTGDAPFTFTTALHTYFRVPHIDAARLSGFGGLTYRDNTQGLKEMQDSAEGITRIEAETDRVYLNAPNELIIRDGFNGFTKVTKSDSLPEAVLWNPWVNKAKTMGDFNDYGWTNMVCVESGAIATPVSVAPGASWTGTSAFNVSVSPEITRL